MVISFVHCLRSEGLKLKRSLASWLILLGGLFVPAIMVAVRFHQRKGLPALYRSGAFWEKHWTQSWESISILILPLMIVLFTALIVQLEYRNNTWKQVHTSPLPLATIFLAKLLICLALLVLLFLVLNLGLYLSGLLPVLLYKDGPLSASPIPYGLFLARNVRYFVDCLPVVALQLLLALRFKSFLVPVGVGTAIWIFSLGILNTSVNYVAPYGYTGIGYLIDSGYRDGRNLPVGLQTLALAAFVAFSLAAYGLYATRKDKG